MRKGSSSPSARLLTEDDWRHLEQLWQNRAINDPLFGAEVSQHFQALAKQLSLPAA